MERSFKVFILDALDLIEQGCDCTKMLRAENISESMRKKLTRDRGVIRRKVFGEKSPP